MHDGISINPQADRTDLRAALADLLDIGQHVTDAQVLEQVRTILRERHDFERLAEMREVRIGELEAALISLEARTAAQA